MEMLIITQAFAEQYTGYEMGCCKFAYGVTNTGEYFCHPNSLNEFPEIFEGQNFQNKDITESDLLNENNI